MILKFIKNWTLPIAMLTGIVGYPVFIHLAFLTPSLIFIMLLLTFSKMSWSDLKPRPPHGWLLLFQIAGSVGIYFIVTPYNEVVAQALMVCVICPTATSAAVITAKLGGSAASVTTYTMLANIVVAVLIPVFFPLIEPHLGITFWESFFLILKRVFVLLICPFLLAWIIQKATPNVHKFIVNIQGLAFYLWACALTIVTSQIVTSLVNYSADRAVAVIIAAASFVICAFQFFMGKTLGGIYNDRVSGGQALGQKNTILAIWMANTYLNPISAVGPGFYVLWQNVINSWQLWKKRRKDERITAE